MVTYPRTAPWKYKEIRDIKKWQVKSWCCALVWMFGKHLHFLGVGHGECRLHTWGERTGMRRCWCETSCSAAQIPKLLLLNLQSSLIYMFVQKTCGYRGGGGLCDVSAGCLATFRWWQVSVLICNVTMDSFNFTFRIHTFNFNCHVMYK